MISIMLALKISTFKTKTIVVDQRLLDLPSFVLVWQTHAKHITSGAHEEELTATNTKTNLQ